MKTLEILAILFMGLLITGIGFCQDGLTVDETGNVGIGIVNPEARLEILGNDSSGIRLKGTDGRSLEFIGSTPTLHPVTGRSSARIIGPKNRSIELEIRGNGAGDAFSIITDPSNGATPDTEVFTVQNNGNVGIGKTSPSYSLDVNGKARVKTLIQTSDVRRKKEIIQLEDTLGKLSKLRGVSYKWKDPVHNQRLKATASEEESDSQEFFPKDNKKHFGLIAQEVEAVYPEMVYTDEEGIKGIAYSQMIGPIIEAVKELKSENEKLKEQLLQLKISIEELSQKRGKQ